MLRIWQASVDVHVLILLILAEEYFRVFIPNMVLDPIEIFQSEKKKFSIPIPNFFKVENPSSRIKLTWLIRFEALERGHSYAQAQAFACQFPEGNPKTEMSLGYNLLSARYLHHFLSYNCFTSPSSNDVFELADSSQADWITEYGRKICSGEIKPGVLLGETVQDECATHLKYEMHKKNIPHLFGDCLLYQALKWLIAMVSLKLKYEGVDTSIFESEHAAIEF